MSSRSNGIQEIELDGMGIINSNVGQKKVTCLLETKCIELRWHFWMTVCMMLQSRLLHVCSRSNDA